MERSGLLGAVDKQKGLKAHHHTDGSVCELIDGQFAGAYLFMVIVDKRLC